MGDGRNRGKPMKKDREKTAVQFVAGLMLILLLILALLGIYQGWQLIADVWFYIFR